MNAALAAKYGVAYVRLCAFAIDIDRAYAELEDDEAPAMAELPFGWEVFLTEAYLLRALPAASDAELGMIEETCLSILEQAPDEQGYGSQLLFAVYDAIASGSLSRVAAHGLSQLAQAAQAAARRPRRALRGAVTHPRDPGGGRALRGARRRRSRPAHPRGARSHA